MGVLNNLLDNLARSPMRFSVHKSIPGKCINELNYYNHPTAVGLHYEEEIKCFLDDRLIYASLFGADIYGVEGISSPKMGDDVIHKMVSGKPGRFRIIEICSRTTHYVEVKMIYYGNKE
jgi:hypothetical protein